MKFRNSFRVWIGLIFLTSLISIVFLEIIKLLIGNWLGSAEYSHGILIPFVSAFFIWQKKHTLANYAYIGSWLGLIFLVAGILFYVFAELSTVQVLVEYALLIVLIAGAWAIVGGPIFTRIWIPLFFLFFAIPLPSFVYQGLSAQLQLISSFIGVSFIRLWNISVYVEGNVIDLGSMQLQVAEACSGLTYLFPLSSVAFICAYLYRVEFWKRVVIFLSSIPITILMNSFRIGVIGVLVEYWGKPMAEGFLHDFEGWIVFMGCTGILVAEMWVLARIGPHPKPLSEVFGLAFPEPWPNATKFYDRVLPKQFWLASVLLLAALGASPLLEQRQDFIPARTEFIDFPMKMGQWSGKRQILDRHYIDTLKFEDYLLADYSQSGDLSTVNLYLAYYASQRKGESIHSPRSCLPGGGWKIQSLDQIPIDVDNDKTHSFMVNRALIQKGEDKQLVYYWFRQRGRDITDEYQSKWYIFWDGLTMSRTDGALIRLMIDVSPNQDVEFYDKRLSNFLRVLMPHITRFVPDYP
jgi:exosortase D (VPLPA-CTERM-specific)